MSRKRNVGWIMILLLISGIAGYAQVSTCGIYYEYDAAGQRVKRYYQCKTRGDVLPENPGPPMADGPIRTLGLDQNSINSDKQTLDAKEALKITIYPNPASQYFKAAFSKPVSNGHYQFTSMIGVVLKSGKLNGIEHHQEVTGLSPGTYLLMLNIAEKRYSYRVVVVN